MPCIHRGNPEKCKRCLSKKKVKKVPVLFDCFLCGGSGKIGQHITAKTILKYSAVRQESEVN